MGRIVGIDYGRVRIGLARSDMTKMLASPLTTLQAGKTPEETVDKLIAAVNIAECEGFVMGLPLHMSGKESEMSTEVRAFGKLLEEKSGKPVSFFDERMSSLSVDRTLREGNLSRKERSQKVDMLSATYVLQGFLDSL